MYLLVSPALFCYAAPGSSVAFCKPCSKGLICLGGTQVGDGDMGMVWGGTNGIPMDIGMVTWG